MCIYGNKLQDNRKRLLLLLIELEKKVTNQYISRWHCDTDMVYPTNIYLTSRNRLTSKLISPNMTFSMFGNILKYGVTLLELPI